jgi:hypothetical protein
MLWRAETGVVSRREGVSGHNTTAQVMLAVATVLQGETSHAKLQLLRAMPTHLSPTVMFMPGVLQNM